ncbi:SRPBCC family protein [Hymenobacter coalescens]
MLPLLAAVVESRFATPDSLRRVENVVDIAAPPAVVWQRIIRVPPIQAADVGPSLMVSRIGFPRPVEATLTHEGVGGVRHATFERGLDFIETVDEWVPQRKLSFSIKPNTATIPPITFDEHVTVGGPFFDVLRGTYELRPFPDGRTRLILYSQQRLSTNLHDYAGLWTDYVMSEIQRRILQVVKRSCEAGVR